MNTFLLTHSLQARDLQNYQANARAECMPPCLVSLACLTAHKSIHCLPSSAGDKLIGVVLGFRGPGGASRRLLEML
jgi:hypothetical protein